MRPHTDMSTILAHAGVDQALAVDPVAPPLYQTAAFASNDADAFVEAATMPRHPGFYTRYGNPTTRAFETAVAALEGGEAAIATASGMAAITAAVMTFAAQGDHIVAQRSLYGGTTGWLHSIAPRIGIDVSFVDQTDADAFARALRPSTRLLMLESPSNPMMRLTDLAAVAAIARAAGVVTLIDSTVASPVNQQPLALGIDLVMHSATKYLAGHGDVTAGVLVGSLGHIAAVWEQAYLLGATLDPHAAWLALRGLRTLPMRMAHYNATAQTVAEHLQRQPAVAAVHYPGLPTHPQAALARRQMPGGFGGVLSFEVKGGLDAAEAVIAGLKHARRSASFGSFSTLVVHPAAMWTGMMSPEQLAEAGLPPGLVRLAVGFEEPEAIIADLNKALMGVST